MTKKILGTLKVIKGNYEKKTFPLFKEPVFIGRPDPSKAWNPDIDLSPDYKVSRRQAVLFLKKGIWYIEDKNSAHGTFVDGNEIKGPVPLSSGQKIEIGRSTLMFFSSDYQMVTYKGLDIGFYVSRFLSYALYRARIPVLSDLTIFNAGRNLSTPFEFSMQIQGLSEVWRRKIGPIQPGEKINIPKLNLELFHEELEILVRENKAYLAVMADGEAIFSCDITVLGVYQWANDPAFRRALACFVQPAHPVVEHLAMEVVSILDIPSTYLFDVEEGGGSEKVLRVLYHNLREYRFHYLHEQAPAGSKYQMLRPPHLMIPRPFEKEGEGTCIDLALLLASVLENLHLQPVIVLVKESDVLQHALLGLWPEVSSRFEPIIISHERFRECLEKEKLILLETTGLTDRFSPKLSYEEAKSKAEAELDGEKFLFALDIAACRQTVTPIEFPMSPEVIGVLRKARKLALGSGGGKKESLLETKHLLLALLLKRGEDIDKILKDAGADLSRIEDLLKELLPARGLEGFSLRSTINYRRAIEDSCIIAGDCGEIFVEERHLFYALLLSQSEVTDRVLGQIGTSRENVRRKFESFFVWTKDIVKTSYEF